VFLSHLLRREAPPPDNQCMSCGARQCTWRCRDCFGETDQCSACFRHRHQFLPFHRVENWTGSHFQPAWLCQVGVEIYLGHNGKPCPSRYDTGVNWSSSGPSSADAAGQLPDDADGDDWGFEADENESDGWTDDDGDPDNQFALPKLKGADACVIVDRSGVHRLRVRPCICPGCSPVYLQYFEMGLFPASMRRVHTAFTFAVLDDFRMDNLECKTAGMRYWNKIVRLTSNAFSFSVPV